MITQGHRLFDRFLRDNDITQAEAADAIGVKPPVIHSWRPSRCDSPRRPEYHLRCVIAIWTRGAVPADSWLVAAERAAIANAQPFAQPDAGH